jgi:hypothetical protein
MIAPALEDLARQAVAGERHVLEQLVARLQGDVYGIALRMLWNREDAEFARHIAESFDPPAGHR